MRQGAALAIIGVAIGVAASLGVSKLTSNLLFGVSTTDPVTFGVLPAFLIGVALLATYIPALRATRVDPMQALRCE